MGKIEMIGKTFGYLTVIEQAASDPKRKEHKWKCLCECGNYTIVPSYRLRHGGVTSCGCHQYDRNFCSKKAKNHMRLYRVYKDMVRRCTYSKDDSYGLYGAKAISVCDEWKTFDPFCDWALANGYDENAPFSKCTLDRIDGNKGYSPENCRWVDMQTQANNTKANHRITAFGKTLTIAEWGRESGISARVIADRLRYGWTPEESVSLPVYKGGRKYHHKADRV